MIVFSDALCWVFLIAAMSYGIVWICLGLFVLLGLLLLFCLAVHFLCCFVCFGLILDWDVCWVILVFVCLMVGLRLIWVGVSVVTGLCLCLLCFACLGGWID